MKLLFALCAGGLILLNGSICSAFNCTITTSPVAFGLYDVLATTPLDSTGNITIACQNPPVRPLTVTVTLSAGGSGSFAQRRMTPSSGSGSLLYNLYTNSSRTITFGDGSSGSATLSNTITRNPSWNVPVYGRVPALQNAMPGVYSDVLTATVLW